MARIPSNATRVPNLLTLQLTQSSLARSTVDLALVQEQLSSGLRINRPSDDPVASSLVSVLTARLAASDQRTRNLEHAEAALNTLDATLAEANTLTLRAREIASSQIGAQADADSRASQVVVVESLLRELGALANEKYADLHIFGGQRTGVAPIEGFFEGYRYVGAGEGLTTDLGALDTPITLGADRAFGSLSARVVGDVDLDPALTASTRLSALGGARDFGVALGAISVQIDPGGSPASITVDLTGAESIGDVMDRVESAVRAADAGALAGAFPSGVTVNGAGTGLALSVSAGYTITISDIGGGTTAADLGLTGVVFDTANPTDPAADLEPRLSLFTTFADMSLGAGVIPGDIVFSNGGRSGTVSLTGATTIGEFADAVALLQLGLRVEINADGRGLSVLNEVSGLDFSVAESGGGTLTATALGIRTFQASTPLSVFNDGRGVEIADGVLDPVSGLPDPQRNLDFRVTLSDGSTFDVDLTPADVVDVSTVLAAINAAAAGAGLAVPADFQARLADGANGILLEDNLGGAAPIAVQSLNGFAAEDLGLLDGAALAGPPATLAGTDRATVRVDSVFTALIELRDALETSDSRGITLAGERLETALDRLSNARAVVGGRGERVAAAKRREEDSRLLDEGVRSSLRDLDYVEATSRFALLDLVRNAGLQTAARTQALSLLDFLG